MRIALDAMGSDRAPTIEVEGAIGALRTLGGTFRLVLVGDNRTSPRIDPRAIGHVDAEHFGRERRDEAGDQRVEARADFPLLALRDRLPQQSRSPRIASLSVGYIVAKSTKKAENSRIQLLTRKAASRPASAIGPTTWRLPASMSRCRAGSRSASATSSPNCGG